MKTDQFDDAFRRKVEELHPPAYPDEADRIHKYVRQHLPLSFWQKFGTGILYSVTAVTVTALLSTLLYQNYVNKTLLERVSELNQKVEKLTVAVSQKADTVRIDGNKAAVRLGASENTQSLLIPNRSGQLTTEKGIYGQQSDNEATAESIYGQQTDNIADANGIYGKKLNNAAESVYGQQTDNIIARSGVNANVRNIGDAVVGRTKKERKVRLLDVAQESQESDIGTGQESIQDNGVALRKGNRNVSSGIESEKSYSETRNNTLLTAQSKGNDKTPITDQAQTKNAFLANPLVAKPFLSDSNLRIARVLPSSAFSQFAVSTVAPPPAHDRFKINWPDISLENLKLRVGVGGNLYPNLVGAGLLAEVLVSKRWSITTGAGVAALGTQEYADEDQFKRRTKNDFRDQSRDQQNGPPNFRAENIRATERLVILPAYINYRMPLKADFTLTVSAGSEFDLALSRRTSFNRREPGPFVPRPNPDANQGAFTEKLRNPFFNNVVLAAGIEKRWKNVSFQLNPSLKLQVINVPYQRQNLMMGLQFRTFYRIGK